ncbi:MAG TPA: hypothetical protein VM285_02895 [Polyangia bacterium]|nr:hypothetical protein [Polyangia bacterium]HUW15783.1 hypothetical protein [Actinomycetes bacterium]
MALAATPEQAYDALAAVVEAVANVSADGWHLENDQTPWTKRDRTFRLIPGGGADAESRNRRGTVKRVHESVTVRMSHLWRPKLQDASRATAYTDLLAVLKALENATTVRIEVIGWDGPKLSETGDFVKTDIHTILTYDLALT